MNDDDDDDVDVDVDVEESYLPHTHIKHTHPSINKHISHTKLGFFGCF
jgi:hypothetical protein